MSAAVILDRLERVRQTAPGRWLARCPAHDDRSPSLSVRELDDGRILVHDFGGCDTGNILAALGLDMAALFPQNLPANRSGKGYSPSRSRIPARDLLEIVSEEVAVVAVIAADFLNRRSIAARDWQRLATAASRIGSAVDHACSANIAPSSTRYPVYDR